MQDRTRCQFLKIVVQLKGAPQDADWRAFLQWVDRNTMTVHEMRGYGKTPGNAADDAYARFNDPETDPEYYTEDSWAWE